MGATTLELPVRAMEDLQLSVYNMDYNLKLEIDFLIFLQFQDIVLLDL